MDYCIPELKDNVCVITGGAGIIGASLARGLASCGVKLAILGRSQSAIDLANDLCREYGVQALGVRADVLDRTALEQAREAINRQLGPIDFLINGAGGNAPEATTKIETLAPGSDLMSSFFGLSVDGFDKVFDLNFKGTLLPTLVFATDMVEKKQGVILNISSMNAYHPLTKIPAYSAAKAAINNFTEWLAVHFAPSGVRVNGIAPGFFLTNQNRFLLTDEKTGAPTARGEKIIRNTPMGRYGQVDELQGTVLYLLSNMSRFVTGVTIPVDGGFNAFSGV